ncbi:hypothetical protein NQ314_020717 [Rhamnusium bicolor]|uniref:Uncharacterized protein n=1 Tax=Rhamnusium bicolor TaxID=1586634 RepID=A0AAV8WK97_9CUCU|nr:hypothetical protein NQ314_020717 [Rhamnusium bicolor]
MRFVRVSGDMNQPSGLLERLSPRPIVCPLVRLGHNSSTDETATSTEGGAYPSENYNYRSQYIDSYEHNTDRRFHNKQLSIDNSYLQKQSPESDYLVSNYL